MRAIKFKTPKGVEYELKLRAPHKKYKADGICHAPESKNPKIYIRPDLERERMIEVVIHEIAHAYFWKESEASITKFALLAKRALKKFDLL